MEAIAKLIEQWAASFEKKIADYEKRLSRRVLAIQAALFDEGIQPFLDELDREAGKIKNSTANIKRANKLEEVFNKFQAAEIDRELRTFAGELISVGALSEDYYKLIGFEATQKQLDAAIETLRAVIGIDSNGNIQKGSYLWRLGRTDEVRAELRQLVVNGISAQTDYQTFAKGIRLYIKGNTGQGINGAFEQYWRQYAYDTYNQANEIVSQHIAENLGFKHFVYQGSIIDSTRDFCRKRAGKAFTLEETKTWKNDPTLIDKKTKDSYNPIIERGRYNCRHFINWISEEIYIHFKSKEKK